MERFIELPGRRSRRQQSHSVLPDGRCGYHSGFSVAMPVCNPCSRASLVWRQTRRGGPFAPLLRAILSARQGGRNDSLDCLSRDIDRRVPIPKATRRGNRHRCNASIRGRFRSHSGLSFRRGECLALCRPNELAKVSAE